MSLDVCLTMPSYATELTTELSDNELLGDGPLQDIPDKWYDSDDEVFTANITHNLGKMAKEAGIYKHLWRPDEIGITKAEELIEPLTNGLALMRSDPDRFTALNPENGWGSYDHFVPWIARYLEACQTYPDADVSVSR